MATPKIHRYDEKTAEQPPAPEVLPHERWAEKHGTPEWVLAATRAFYGWGLGQEVSEERFLACVHNAKNIRIG